MIPANGLVATFDSKHGILRRPLIGWGDDGEALIIDDETHARVNAFDDPDFAGIDFGPIGVLPGGGWRVRWTHQNGSTLDEPLIGWVVRGNPWEVDPITLDDSTNGTTILVGDYEIYHPDTRHTGPDEEKDEARS